MTYLFGYKVKLVLEDDQGREFEVAEALKTSDAHRFDPQLVVDQQRVLDAVDRHRRNRTSMRPVL